MPNNPITAVLVGSGHRAIYYASWALEHPDQLRIVGVADPDELRRKRAQEMFGFAPENSYASAQALADAPKIADAVINGTMDRDHVPTTLPLLEAGYDVLLEKPIAPTGQEVLDLLATARRTGRTVMICHVLRYAPFYAEIKRRLLDGVVGEIMGIYMSEAVSYHHMGVAFVRGKWRRRADSNPSLLSKCCHDLDIMAWMMSGTVPRSVASFGSLKLFRPEKAPKGAGQRCLVDCEIEDTCPYSCKKNFIDQAEWPFYAWEPIEHLENPTLEQKLESLRTDNPYGRCVWHCDNDVVDHQSVLVEFSDGAVCTHTMIGGASWPVRRIHIVGSKGEIEGAMEQGKFVIRHPDARAGHEYSEELIQEGTLGDGHGGGDMLLVEDFVRVLRGEEPSISKTDILDSVYGHLIAYAADDAMEGHKVVEIGPV